MSEVRPMTPREEAFWTTHLRHDEEAQARAGLLEELISLVLPEAPLSARPIRERDGGGGQPERVAELERLFGSLSARARAVAWLDAPAVLLEGGYGPDVRQVRAATAGDTGFLEGERLHLLLDGRLVVVRLAGVWDVEHGTLRTHCVLVDAREVTPEDAVDRFAFASLLSALRACLTLDFTFLEGKHVPDLDARLERFDALVRDYGVGLGEFVAHVRRVGDSPP